LPCFVEGTHLRIANLGLEGARFDSLGMDSGAASAIRERNAEQGKYQGLAGPRIDFHER
jgi:hypothetical protein